MRFLNTSPNLSALADRDVVIEAVVENEEVKTKLYRELQADPAARRDPGVEHLDDLDHAHGQAVGKPENFAGLHFFNPVDRMQLVEVIRGEKTSDATVVTLVALAKKLGKTPIVVKDCPGFLVNRILFPYLNEAMVLLEEGAEPRALDKAATEFGMPMGPITLSDVVGLDTCLYAGMVVNRAFTDRAKPNAHPRRAGRGGPARAEKRRRVLQLRQGLARQRRSGPRGDSSRNAAPPSATIGADELRDRLFLPMLIEATLVLSEGIVREPADVDMGLILGIGFPPQHGGLLRWADTQGLGTLLTRLAKYEPLGKRYQPTELMSKLAAAARDFSRGEADARSEGAKVAPALFALLQIGYNDSEQNEPKPLCPQEKSMAVKTKKKRERLAPNPPDSFTRAQLAKALKKVAATRQRRQKPLVSDDSR